MNVIIISILRNGTHSREESLESMITKDETSWETVGVFRKSRTVYDLSKGRGRQIYELVVNNLFT